MDSVPICGVILAAGQSSRMGEDNKLCMMWHDKPLVQHVLDAVSASRLDRFCVITGHEAERVEALLPRGCATFRNSDYANGMAGSIRAGIYRLQGRAAVMILLGDMPMVESKHIDELISAYSSAASEKAIVVATADGQWGNPVLFGPSYFTALKLLEGDSGARTLIKAHRDHVIEIEIGEAAQRDFDTPESFAE